MKNSKKIVAIALALVMLVGGVIAGTMAWFVDDEQATNTIVVGDVGILLHESNGDTTDEQIDDDYRNWLDNQWMLPSEGNDGNELAKIVTVENNGSNDAYVRVKIYVPKDLKDVIHFNQGENWTAEGEWTAIDAAITAAREVAIGEGVTEANYVEYTLYYLAGTNGKLVGNHNAQVDGAAVANTTTSAAIDSIYLDKYVDCDSTLDGEGNVTGITYWNGRGDELTELSDDGKADIIVVAEAIQAAGHTDATEAWKDFEDQVGLDKEAEDYKPYYTPKTIVVTP